MLIEKALGCECVSACLGTRLMAMAVCIGGKCHLLQWKPFDQSVGGV